MNRGRTVVLTSRTHGGTTTVRVKVTAVAASAVAVRVGPAVAARTPVPAAVAGVVAVARTVDRSIRRMAGASGR